MGKTRNKPKVMLDSNIIISGIIHPRYCFVTGDKGVIDNIAKIKIGFSCLTPSAFLNEIIGWKNEDLEAIKNRIWEEFNK